MDFYLARAMQIAALDIGQISDLHTREKERGYCLANWHIQKLYGLPTIKERFLIPEEGCEQHAQRIRTELLSQKVAQWIEFEKVDEHGQKVREKMAPWEWATMAAVPEMHLFDAKVYDAAQDGRINFVYEGGAKSGSLRDRVGAGRRSFDKELP